MMKRHFSAWVLPAALLLTGCSQTAGDNPSGELFIESGTYAYFAEGFFEESSQPILGDSITVFVELASRTDSLHGFTGLVRMDGEQVGTDYRASTWYQVTADGIKAVAHTQAGSPGGVALPRPAVALNAELMEAALEAIGWPGARVMSSDEVVIRPEPRLVYRLPLQVGAQWVNFQTPFLSTSEVVRLEEVTVGAGTFTAYVIRTDIDLESRQPGEYLHMWAHVAPGHGMVSRVLEGRGRAMNEQGEPIGWFQFTFTAELISR